MIMNEENKNNNQANENSTYQIPGVIIPDQVTDSGNHISQNLEEKKEIKTEEQAQKQEDKSEGNIYTIPGVIIPEQTTENGTIKEINNVTEENIYKAPEKEVIILMKNH